MCKKGGSVKRKGWGRPPGEIPSTSGGMRRKPVKENKEEGER